MMDGVLSNKRVKFYNLTFLLYYVIIFIENKTGLKYYTCFSPVPPKYRGEIMSKIIDETGHVYGYLTVIERADNDNNGRARWKCKCKCGNETIVLGKHLRSGNTKSCGCYQKEKAIESNINRTDNIIGKKFGKLTVISEEGFIVGNNGKRRRIYNCLCDCGNYCQIQHQYL